MRKRSTGSSSRGSPGPRRRGPSRPSAPLRVRGPVPVDPATLERVLAVIGVEPKRALGQNFLLDPGVAEREAALLDVPPGSPVLEVGGGVGQLTHALLQRGFQVTVIEKEPRFAAYLAENFPRARTIAGDATEVPIPPVEACTGNLPFSHAAEILQRLVAHGMAHGAFLLQKEVAERLTSPPGFRAYGRSTILYRVDGVFTLAGRVPSESFYPRPKVEGALVVWRRDPLEPPPRDRQVLERVLEAAFGQRRKVLGHAFPPALARRFHFDPHHVPTLLEEAGWPRGWERQRAEEISPEAYVALSNLLKAPGAAP